VLAVVAPRTITTGLFALTGLLLLVGVNEGIYVLVPSMIAAMIGVASAWLFLTRAAGKAGPVGGIDPLAICSSRRVLAQHDAFAVGRQLQVQIGAVWELHDDRIGCAPHLAAAEVAL
jgi:hypothetical protein